MLDIWNNENWLDVLTLNESFTGCGLPKSFDCRLLFKEFHFLAMSEEVMLDGVNVMCKVVWTNETWVDCCILTFFVSSEKSTLLCKLTFKSRFSAVAKRVFLHAIFRDLKYLDNWNLIRPFWCDPGSLYRARFRLLLFHRMSVCHFWCLNF